MEFDLIAPITKSPLDSMRGRGGKHIFRVRFTPKSRTTKSESFDKQLKTLVQTEIATTSRVDTCPKNP